MFTSSGTTLNNNADYQALSQATKDGKLKNIIVLSIPGTRSSLLNFVLSGANVEGSAEKFVALHEPFIQDAGDPKSQTGKSAYSVYAKSLNRINQAYQDNYSKEKKSIGLTIKDHCVRFTTGEDYKLDEKMFREYLLLAANTGIILSIREPVAVFNNRLRAMLNFKLTEKGGLRSEKFFTAFFQNDCATVHQEILELLNKNENPIDKKRLLNELNKPAIDQITIEDWENFRVRFLKEKDAAFRLAWSKAKEVYEILKKYNYPIYIVNTSEMCKEPEKYLKVVMDHINGAQFNLDMINNIPKKSSKYIYPFFEYGQERITNIFLNNSLTSTAIHKETEKNHDLTKLPKEILETLEFVNQIYTYLDSSALKNEPEKEAIFAPR